MKKTKPDLMKQMAISGFCVFPSEYMDHWTLIAVGSEEGEELLLAFPNTLLAKLMVDIQFSLQNHFNEKQRYMVKEEKREQKIRKKKNGR